ncbi:MAG: hypothetical protein ACREED_09465 [Stellaceae bacterium]
MSAIAEVVHPDLLPALHSVAARLEYAGTLGENGGTHYAITIPEATLAVSVGPAPSWTVRAVRHAGARDEELQRLLDVLCRAIEGLPLREAADHGAIHALERLHDATPSLAIRGIVTVRSAGPGFFICETLIRGILREHERRAGPVPIENFWNPPLSEAWRRMDTGARLATLKPIVGEFRAAAGVGENDLRLVRIERMARIIVGFGAAVGHDQKPILLRKLEAAIRRKTGDRLELYMEEMKDDNTIRRLQPEKEPSP